MNDKRFYILTLVFDSIIIASSAFGTISALVGFYFMMDVERMASAPYFCTFTGLSNLYVGLVALTCLIVRIVKKEAKLPLWAFLLKLSSVSMIGVTMLTTAVYLVPSAKESWWRLYVNANLINHLVTPVLAFIGYVVFEKKMEFKYKFVPLTIVPLFIYIIFYLIRAIPHYNPSGEVDLYYDIYAVTRVGIIPLFGFILVFLGLALLLSTGLYFQNQKKK